MKFIVLSSYLEKLEKEASRNKITEILSDLFKKSSVDEIDKIVYLVLGQIAPNYQGLVLNMAEKMMIRVIANASKVSEEKVMELYKKEGDLGDVSYKLIKGKSDGLTVNNVYEKLVEIANDSGLGSQERKVIKLSKLLSNLDPLSAKYVCRIPVGKLRLGFSDMTILDALSFMLKGDKSARKEIEAAFNVSVDTGKIAKVVKEKGLLGINQIEAQAGTPIRPALAERLPSAEKMLEKVGKKVIVEPKYDGFRCIGGFTPVYIENRGYISIKDVKVGDKILTHKGRFEKINKVYKRKILKKEKLFKFQSYFSNFFKISEGHKLLIWRNGKNKWMPVEKVLKTDQLVFPYPKLFENRKIIFPNKRMLFSNSEGYSKTVFINNDFYRFLGFWIGDGYTNNYHNTERIGLIFNAKTEEKLAKEYKEIVIRIFGVTNVSKSYHNGALYLYWRDKPLREWLSLNFRREWKGKNVPTWFNHISKEEFESFLRGWIESDGTERHSGGYKITTKERDLASSIQLLGLHHKIILGLRKIGVKNKRSKLDTYYEITVPGTQRYVKIFKDKILIKILRLEEIVRPDSRINLYNLEVESDESYCTGMVALHNCQTHILKQGEEKKVLFFSRNLENTTHMFPDLVEAALKVDVESAIFDGEAIAYDEKNDRFLPFQETVQRKRKHGIEKAVKDVPLKLFIFDILFKDGKSLLNFPFSERRKELEKVNFSDKRIEIARQNIVDSASKIRDLIKKYLAEGLEGAMIKKIDDPYRAGARGYHWVKYKKTTEEGVADTVDCLVMGTYKGKGRRSDFGVGAFLAGIKDKEKFKTVSKIGTGLTDEQWKELERRTRALSVKEKPKEYILDKNLNPDTWVKPSLVVEILADEITKSPIHSASLALRFPRLVRFRDDKKAKDTNNLQELKKLFEMQKV